jgi:pimeloyl-ACP methyl ester carboxylesterase
MSVETRASWGLPETFAFEGQAVRFGCLGRADRPPLVLLHGTPFSSVVWRRIAPHLIDHRHSTLRVVPKAGHLLQEDAPEAVVAALLGDFA